MLFTHHVSRVAHHDGVSFLAQRFVFLSWWLSHALLCLVFYVLIRIHPLIVSPVVSLLIWVFLNLPSRSLNYFSTANLPLSLPTTMLDFPWGVWSRKEGRDASIQFPAELLQAFPAWPALRKNRRLRHILMARRAGGCEEGWQRYADLLGKSKGMKVKCRDC